MSEPNTSQEPSMEEILASIRRIISEEDQEDQAAAPAPEPAAKPAATPSEPPNRSAKESVAAAVAAAAAPSVGAKAETGDVYDLTEMVDDNGNVVNLSDQAKRRAAAEPEKAPEKPYDVDLVDPPQMPEPEPEFASAVEFELAAMGGGEGLLSRPAEAASVAPLAGLARAVGAEHGGTPIGNGGRTIEDLVKEVMRPMIKQWLDDNLPHMVERMVRKEIDRIARRAEDS